MHRTKFCIEWIALIYQYFFRFWIIGSLVSVRNSDTFGRSVYAYLHIAHTCMCTWCCAWVVKWKYFIFLNGQSICCCLIWYGWEADCEAAPNSQGEQLLLLATVHEKIKSWFYLILHKFIPNDFIHNDLIAVLLFSYSFRDVTTS